MEIFIAAVTMVMAEPIRREQEEEQKEEEKEEEGEEDDEDNHVID